MIRYGHESIVDTNRFTILVKKIVWVKYIVVAYTI